MEENNLRHRLMVFVRESLRKEMPEKVYLVRIIKITLRPEVIKYMIADRTHRIPRHLNCLTMDHYLLEFDQVVDVYKDKEDAHKEAKKICCKSNLAYAPIEEPKLVEVVEDQTRYWTDYDVETVGSHLPIGMYTEVWEMEPAGLMHWYVRYW